MKLFPQPTGEGRRVIFCDISTHEGTTAGAFIVDGIGPKSRPISGKLVGTNAEVELMVMLILEFGDMPLAIYTDVSGAETFMKRGKRHIWRKLAWACRGRDVRFFYTAKSYQDHWKCHHAARVRTGLMGTQHPMLPRLLAEESSRKVIYESVVA